MKPQPRTVGRFCWMTAGLGWPRFLAWAASFAALVLAIVPGALSDGRYDALLAVLTATLIAAVWAGFFAFRSVHPPAAVRVSLDTHLGEHALILKPAVHNPTTRAIQARVFLNVWLKHRAQHRTGGEAETELLDLGGFYRGERPKLLGPQDGFTGFLNLSPRIRLGEDVTGYGPEQLTGEALAEMWVGWTDDLCESGRTEPRHWQILGTGAPAAVIDPSRVAELFRHLPREPQEPEPDTAEGRSPSGPV